MDRLRRLSRTLGVMSLALGPTLARADWPASPLVNVPLCTAAGGQDVSAVLGDGLGGMIVVWHDTRSDDGDIYAQRVSAGGVTQWTAIGIAVCVAGGEQLNATAIPDGAGGAIVAWQDFRSGATADVYAQRIDAGGTTLWAADGVPLCTASGHQLFPKVASDRTGGAVIVWTDQRTSGHANFYAQRVSGDGTPQWVAGGVGLTTTLVEQQQPAVTTDDSGGVIITWHAPDSVYTHAWAQRVDGSGLPRWGPDGIALANVSTQLDPKIASDGSGGAIVAWADYRDGNGLTATSYAQRVNAAGAPQWTPNGVALATPSGDQQYQAVVTDGVGGAVVVWSDYSSTAIRAQRVSASGAPQWPLSGVSVCSATGERQVNRVQPDGTGGILVPWSGDGDVYVQHVSAAGAPVWAADGVATCTAIYGQAGSNLIPDGVGGALVAWSDYRDGDNWRVYAQNIGSGGTLGGSTLAAAGPRPLAVLAISGAGPNPHRGTLAVDCSLPNGETAVVGLFDVSGRCLETHAVAGLGAGTQHVSFATPTGEQASGVYLARLVQGGRSVATRLVLIR